MHLNRKIRKGFTLVELLVVIAIIGTLMALLLPALSSARSASNASASTNNLSAFGRGFELYASTHDGNYTSGAFDHFRDGDVRSWGWVADLIGSKVASPGKALDPAHRSKVSETVADYTGAVATNQGNLKVEADGGHWADGTVAADVVDEAAFGGDAGAKAVWDEGYNSNYITTWHFSRGDPSAVADGFDPGTRAITDGDGPLSQNIVSQAKTTAARIALMAPGRPNVSVTSQMATDINDFTGGKGTGAVKANDKLTQSLTAGMTVDLPASLGGAANEKVHNLTGIFPLHQPKTADGKGGFAPVLFADLHVEKVADSTNDGFIGSDGSAALTDATFQEASDLIWMKRLRDQQ